MSNEKIEFDLKSAIFNTGLIQPVESSMKGGRLSIICRQIPGQEAPWIQLIPKLLKAAEEANIDLHLCRKYVLRGGKMVYGWHLGVDAKNAKAVQTFLDEVLKPVLEKAKPVLHAAASPGKHPIKPSKDPMKAAYQPGPSFKDQPKKSPPPGRIQYNFENNNKVIYAPMGTESNTDNPVAVMTSRKITKDRRGRNVIEEVVEVPLPHIHTEDMNKPNERGGGVLNPLYDVPLALQGHGNGKVG